MAITIDSRIISAVKVASQYPVITRVGVFGSFARGEQTEHSDIDILYDYTANDKDPSFVLEILNFIADAENALKEQFGYDIESDYISLPGLMDSDVGSMRKRILNDVVWIYEKKHGLTGV